MKKGVLSNFTKFTGKHMCQSLFFNKVAGLRHATLLKKRFWPMCFPVNFVKFLRTLFLQNTSGRLLLVISSYETSVGLFLHLSGFLLSAGLWNVIKREYVLHWEVDLTKGGIK